MRRISFEIVEPGTRPVRRVHEVVEGETIVLHALALTADSPRGLRRIVVRKLGEPGPAGCTEVVTLSVERAGASVVHTGEGVLLEQRRAEFRSQVVSGIRLPFTALLDLTLPDQSRLSFAFELHRDVERGAAVGVAGSGTRISRVRYAADNVWWLITDTAGIVATAGQKIWDSVRDRLMKAGMDSQAVMFGMTLLVTAGLGAASSYHFYSQASDQQSRAEEAESSLDRAKAAQASSLATELACLAERQKLVEEVGDRDRKRALAVESALTIPLANTVAVELGGSRMAGQDVLTADLLTRNNLLAAISGRLGVAVGDPTTCLAQERALGNDLPKYALLWHPDPTLTCPADYTADVEGVRRIGNWGLSDRVAREFGAAGQESTGAPEGTLESLLADPRRETRWSAFTLSSAFRSVQDTLLRTSASPRPPTLPSQAQLWSLALLDAYNRFPSMAEGMLDGDVRECVALLLTTRVADAAPAAPGEPILPEISAVAAGDVEVRVQPTTRCPWTSARLAQGADSALRAVARLAQTQLSDTQGGR